MTDVFKNIFFVIFIRFWLINYVYRDLNNGLTGLRSATIGNPGWWLYVLHFKLDIFVVFNRRRIDAGGGGMHVPSPIERWKKIKRRERGKGRGERGGQPSSSPEPSPWSVAFYICILFSESPLIFFFYLALYMKWLWQYDLLLIDTDHNLKSQRDWSKVLRKAYCRQIHFIKRGKTIIPTLWSTV